MKLIKALAGLVVALLLLVAIALWILPPRLIHWGIEHYGSQGVGAKVDVGDVNFSWLDSKLEILDLAVTNPSQPMENALQLDRVTTQFDLMRLFDSKVYLDLVLVEGITLDAARQSSGALPGVAAVEQEESEFSMPNLGLPDTSEMVAKEKALYQSKIDGFNKELEQRQKNWQAIVDKMPDEAKLDQYQQQWKQAKSGNFLEKVKAADDIRKQVKKDIKQIKAAQNQLDAEYGQLQSDYKNLKGLSDQSLDQIIKQLGLSDSILANVGNAVIGGKAQQWLQTGQGYYQLLLGGQAGSSDGVSQQALAKTSPDFLVKLLRLTGPFKQGDRTGTIEGQIENISEAPDLYSDPINVDIKAVGELLGNISMQGVLDHRAGKEAKDNISVSVKDSVLTDFALSQSDALSVLLEKAKLNFDANAKIVSGDQLNLDMEGLFSDFAVQLAGSQSQEAWADSLINSMQKMNVLTLDAKADGQVDKPNLKVSSNLNDVFKSVLGNVIKEKSATVKKQVKGELDQALTEQLAPINDKMTGLASYGKVADDRLDEFNQLLKTIK